MILDDIVRQRREDVAKAVRDVGYHRLEASQTYSEPRRGFAERLRRDRVAIIAEVKKASPSRGVIRADFDPVAIARAYQEAGADAVSVLTEERYFRGNAEHLTAIRRAVGLPLLRKDFLFDPYQIVEARAWGADAVLLIVAILGRQQLAELLAAAAERQLDTLVEVHDEGELECAVEAKARVIGINNRDLRTFKTTLETAERLHPLVPRGVVSVAESGIGERGDVKRMSAAGFDALLIGECLMRATDPGAKLRELLLDAGLCDRGAR